MNNEKKLNIQMIIFGIFIVPNLPLIEGNF